MGETQRGLGLRSILTEAFAVFRQRAGLLVLITFSLTLPISLFNWFFGDDLVIGSAGLLIGTVVDAWLSGILVLLIWPVVNPYPGTEVSLFDALKVPLGYLVPLVLLVAGTEIAVGIGVVLLIVPGVLLYTAWFVALPILVIERTGVVKAWSKSRELTRNHVRNLVWVCALLLLVGYLPLATSLLVGFGAATTLISFVMGVVLLPFETVTMAVVYRKVVFDQLPDVATS